MEVARTVCTVQEHTSGRKAGMPDIPGDIERSVAVVDAVARHLQFLPDPRSALLAVVADQLERSERGESREHIIQSAIEEGHHLIDAELKDASTKLSTTTGITPSALRTRPGWNEALDRDGHGKGRLSELDDLPGTLTVLAVKNLVELGEIRRVFNSADLYTELLATWDTARPSGRGFDAVIDAAGNLQETTSRVGWALITLEGRKHVNLIWHQANKLQRSFPDRESSELLTWGWLGLRTALRNYNPALGFAFSTYAVTRIVGAIRDGVRAENPVPKRLGTLARKVAVVEADLARSLGRAATMHEVGVALNLESAQLAAVRRTKTPASIEEIVAGLDRSGGNEPDWLAADTDTAESAVTRMVRDTVSDAIAELPPEEAQAIRLLVLEDRSPTEARLIAGVTARQLRQRKERGLNTLRTRLEDLDLENT
jgi:RNA polymerase sigma factor FliA